MKHFKLVFALIVLTSLTTIAQNTLQQNSSQRILSVDKKGITLGGYAQIDYNEYDGSKAGKLDVHRMVLLFGYKFNDKVSFLTEVELEHVKEVYVEQAFLKYQARENFNVLAGLMLVPMGIINEYHEPTTYYGVERPNVDKYIVPTTWRELGIGVSGTVNSASLKYQAYIFNGFKSYADGEGVLRGSDGLRKGRQKGAESVISNANLSAKLDYYGIPGLRLGVSGYFGKTQTDETELVGSQVGVAMLGFDARYRLKNFQFRGQYISTTLNDTEEYNTLTGKDLGSKMDGLYAEVAYDFPLKGVEVLTPFIRYENYNTHSETDGTLVQNSSYDRDEIIFGLNWKVANGAAFKADYQIANNAVSGSDATKTFNAGVAVWF
ncbi:hypothetical protein SAMN05444411_102352 [Lutibacter oricola]|uniref:Phosphate-selective porin O and P n=1 Tax=Lutibacter oricola TaxID=762486 RepID=A0A1H2X3Q0_9FLAO|nr:hypothetical protein [Lutibacter oricola]SDW87114.1 hypothetical protein SAMN05444411_102352 [Lutibacter oricola]